MTHPAILLKKLITIKRRIAVKRSAKPYLIQQGWRPNGSERRWEGFYRTRYASYKGKIEHPCPPSFTSTIRLSRYVTTIGHVLQSCTVVGTQLTSRSFPKDADSGVMAIERLINEAFLLLKKTA